MIRKVSFSQLQEEMLEDVILNRNTLNRDQKQQMLQGSPR